MTTLVGIDPGLTTGWCHVNYDTGRCAFGQVSPDQFWDWLEQTKPTDSNNNMFYIIEKFNFRQISKANLTPVEIIGVFKEWFRQQGGVVKVASQVIWQNPSDRTPNFWTQWRLDRLYVPGKPHAMDALRHVLSYLDTRKKIVFLKEGGFRTINGVTLYR